MNNNMILEQSTGNQIAKRLFDFIKAIDSNPSAFERNCNISNGYLSKLFKDGKSIGSQILVRIKLKYQALNINWVITGEGSMIEY